jgi:hypothetical protein
MDLITTLEKRFGHWAIPNLTLYLLAIQAIGVALLMGGYSTELDLILHGSSVIHRGEWWRLLSFMMMPKIPPSIWLLLAFYIFYLMGTALEREWGTFRYNLFILCGYLFTILAAFISPGVIVTNTYFLGCVFLAFATLFPEFEFHLFFILPVKVKWLGWLTAGFYILTLLGVVSAGPGVPDFVVKGNQLSVGAAFANYLLFFGKDFYLNIRSGQRRKAFQSERAATQAQPLHVCAACGASDKSDDALHFRYCSTCGKCFCEKHIANHDHAA